MTDQIDFDQIREIIRIAEESGLAELEVEQAGFKVRVRRAATAVGQTGQPAGAATTRAALDTYVPAAAAAAGGDAAANHLEPVVAPMVGTFYRASAPDAPPLVSEGDFVDEGQVVCVIEAMKLFNEIQTDKRGRVARVLVENASPVEFGQPLLLLDPTAARG
jgi:acetyl-CoA carboxylase biotin carboxyl carrier protein